MKLICKIFGHKWRLKPKPDILSNKRVCTRCRRVERRVKFTQTPELVETWIVDIPMLDKINET